MSLTITDEQLRHGDELKLYFKERLSPLAENPEQS